ncbi:hypothetical protein S40293_03480 [Stachybotrys chartarum IBT 40293]|nr:hypothetical protein S40293_03480 [Stachybotrys chartarum IBT 40293]
MSSALKSVVLRWPAARPIGLAQCCPKASFSTATGRSATRSLIITQLPLRSRQQQQQQQVLAAAPRVLSRAASDLASSAQKSPNATNNKTATALGEKPQVKPTPTSANVGVEPTLDWNTFFKLRLRRRRVQVLFSITSSLVGGVGGALLLSTGVAEPLVSLIPLEPYVTLGIMVITFAGMGWLVGPIIGSEVFYMLNGKVKKQIRIKESEFLSRVKRNRADPSNSSASNPVPDFYGEKIQSVAGYRRWLKDQRAFNRKKNAAFV